MSFRYKFTGLVLISLFPLISCAQSDTDRLIEQIIEYIAENVEEDHDYSELTERLNYYKKTPLNINTVHKEQLQELVFISPVQINNLLMHRNENGEILDPMEVQSIPGFDIETVRWLLNFIRIEPSELFDNLSVKGMVNKSEHDLMLRFGKILEKQAGFMPSESEEPVYPGSGFRIFTRYRYNYNNKIHVSLNMEKDAGEVFLKDSGKGFDFYSASISLKGKRFVKKLILGDYALQFGQGLTMWSGLGFGKGAGPITVAKQDIGLKPYSSVNESLFLRGISSTFGYKRISVTPFMSYKRLDASLSRNGEISSLNVSGLHRTNTELKNKNIVSQLVYGLNSQYTTKRLTAGFTAYRTQLSTPVAIGNSLYEKYNFIGHSLTNVGLHYNYTFRNAYFFGEAAHSLSSGWAFVNGLMASISSQVSIVLLNRNYARDYHSFFNQGIAEATEAVNEKGLYSGVVVKFNNQFEWNTYVDVFRFPWLKFRVDAPSKGHEMSTQLTYNPNKKIKITARFRQQIKEENVGESLAGGLDPVDKQNYRIELNYKVNNSISFRNRAEVSSYKKGTSSSEFGFLSYQDIIYDPLSSKISGNLRFAIFDTQGFNSRIYTYENDVLYGYSVPAYQGRGIRCYSNIRYTIKRGLDLWLRYALLDYSNQETVGSGNDMIQGNQRSDIKFQLRYQF